MFKKSEPRHNQPPRTRKKVYKKTLKPTKTLEPTGFTVEYPVGF